jgi:NDP-sugar pyrophosphorylase family protein
MLPCAILCGGLATRLRPITDKIPKSLIPINGEPFIALQLRLLYSKGLRHVVLCVGYLGEMIQEFVGDGAAFGLSVSYSFDGTLLLGTAGAIRKALPLLGESFFVLYGDSYLTCDYGDVAGAFQAARTQGLMTIYRNEGRFDASNVEMSNGLILRYDKRNRTPAMHHIDYGLCTFAQSAFKELSPNEYRDLSEVCHSLAASGRLAGYEVDERFYEIGSEQGILDLERYLAERSDGTKASDRATRTI